MPVAALYLRDLWERPEAARAGDDVRHLLEHPGWPRLLEAIEARLRHEQRVLMNTDPQSEERYDRIIGRWAGLRSLEGIAKSVVDHGKQAEEEMNG